MLRTMRFHSDRMKDSAKQGFTNATDVADYLVNRGVPFRDAHGMVGQLVLKCIEKKVPLDDLPIKEYQKICPVFKEDIYNAISLRTCVSRRTTVGAPGMEAMEEVIQIYRKYMEAYETELELT